MLQKTLYFSAFVYEILFSCIEEDLLSALSIFARQNTQIIMLRGNHQRLRSGFSFRLPTVWDAPSSLYKVSMHSTAHFTAHFSTFSFPRTSLPVPMLSRDFSVWAVLKHCIGKVKFPVFLVFFRTLITAGP